MLCQIGLLCLDVIPLVYRKWDKQNNPGDQWNNKAIESSNELRHCHLRQTRSEVVTQEVKTFRQKPATTGKFVQPAKTAPLQRYEERAVKLRFSL
jgi:hypothetical protein